jgi:hypothetical protein
LPRQARGAISLALKSAKTTSTPQATDSLQTPTPRYRFNPAIDLDLAQAVIDLVLDRQPADVEFAEAA